MPQRALTPVASLVDRELGGSPVVGALVDGRPLGLSDLAPPGAQVIALTLASPAGRDIFRRSAALAFLEAARRAGAPPVRMGASITTGVIALLSDAEPAAWAGPIEGALGDLVAADVPIAQEVWGIEEAITELDARGWSSAVDLLEAEIRPHVTLVRCGDLLALGSGPMLPSTRYLDGIHVVPHPQGLLLDLGDVIRRELPRRKVPTLILETRAPRYGAEMTQSERVWLEKLGITSVGSLNRACVSGRTRQIVNVSEGYHEKRIAEVADAISVRREVRVVGIAGPSSSGKTTFIKRLKIQLEIDGVRPVELSLDDYFLDRDRTPRDEHGELDFESLEALDLDLLDRHLGSLLRGETVKTARFDFRTGKSHREGGPELTISAGDILLLEGLHALSSRILASAPPGAAFRVFVHPALSLPFDRLSILEPADVRLLRRIVRDRHERGNTAVESLSRWRSVARGERLHVFPHQGQADRVFDTSLVYEPCVLKVFAERYLMEVPRGHPEAAAAHRLRRLLEPFVPIDPGEVPPISILREFIGKSGFSY